VLYDASCILPTVKSALEACGCDDVAVVDVCAQVLALWNAHCVTFKVRVWWLPSCLMRAQVPLERLCERERRAVPSVR
jgi:hypothetical protein